MVMIRVCCKMKFSSMNLNSRKVYSLTLAILFQFSYFRKSKSILAGNFVPLSDDKKNRQNGDIFKFTSHLKLKDSKNSNLPFSSITNFSSIPAKYSFHTIYKKQFHHIQSLKNSVSPSVSFYNSVDFMMNLYNYKSGKSKINGKLNKILRRSDVVRCFEAIDFYTDDEKWNLVFDTSAISPHERIRLAEIKFSFQKKDTKLTSFELWDERKMHVSNQQAMVVRRKIGSIVNATRGKSGAMQTISADITKVIRHWCSDSSKKNKPKTPQTHTEFEAVAKSVKQPQLELSLTSYTLPRPMLFVYSTNKHIELFDVAAARQSRSKRSSKKSRGRKRIAEKYKHTKRKSRKRNRTEKLPFRKEVRHNEVEIIFPEQQERTPQLNDFEEETPKQDNFAKEDDLEKWREEQSDVVIVANEAPKKVTTEKVFLAPVHFESGSKHYLENHFTKPRHCRKVDYSIDFEKIGWGDWIVFPKRYNAYKCEGECRVPLAATKKPTNHAFMQSLLSINRPESGINPPCCVPSKLLPLSILYYEEGAVKQRDHEDMVVAECDCR